MRALRLIILLIFALQLIAVQGQQIITPDASSCDCKGRKLITDTVVQALTTPPGPGIIREMPNGITDQFSFEKEHHTIWYEFEVPRSAWLEFTILPERPEDDYDFMLFQLSSPFTCDSIAAGLLMPVRSVISRTDPAIGGITGLHDTAIETHIGRGPGPAAASLLRVRKGERYIIAIDNVYPEGKGHRFELHYLPVFEEPQLPAAPSTFFILSVTDSLSIPITAAIQIRLRYPREGEKALILDTLSSGARITMQSGVFYVISIRKDGYLAYSENLRTKQSQDTVHRECKLEALRVGKSLIFDNVYFRGGSEQFMPGAMDALKQILALMKDNPTIRVEIQGHVNQPYNLISRMGAGESKELSERRARAVYDYLVRKGIDPSRLSYQGYGNSRMIYPYARDEAEMQQNRRVEIVITEIISP
jgi:outer membrane protein OmpA-like peptidoglycan-associated protein